MANLVTDKVSVQHLEFQDKPPLPISGGRLMTPAGELSQIIAREAVHHIVYIEFKPDGKPRGHHYHRKMSHAIYVIKGKIQVTIVSLEDDSRMVVNIEGGDIIRIKPHCAHVFLAFEYSQALELNDLPYDPADTLPYIINLDDNKAGLRTNSREVQ